jgi:hypothetical protein
MRFRPASARPLATVLLLGAALAGCGKSLPGEGTGRGAAVTTVPGNGALAASGLTTRNTTRLGGADPIADAAAVALAVDPGLTPETRPPAVVLVDARDWPAALAAAALAAPQLGAPLLYSEGDSLPAISAQALATLRPHGSAALGGAQVIAIGTDAAPAGYRVRALRGGVLAGGANPGHVGAPAANRASAALEASAQLAARVAGLLARALGTTPRHVLVVGAEGPRAFAMPAAGLAAESGSPILLVGSASVPAATRRALRALHRPAIYALGPPAAVSDAVLAKLARYGVVHRIAPTPGTHEAVANAIALARYSDGSFGWGVEEPGHGLVFASAARPLDAPAAAPLSASGDFGPLLLLEGPRGVPPALATYLTDIQPSYPEYQPTRGFYNHGWLIGDEAAIAARTQAELDALLEIAPHASAGATSTATTPSATTP